MPATYSQHEDLLDGEITIFILASAIKPLWQVRFRNPLDSTPRYIRKTTGHTSKALATAKAVEIYNEYQSRSLLNLTSGAMTIDDLMDDFSIKMSKVMRAAANGFHRTYWQSYFGNADVSRSTIKWISEPDLP